MTLHWWMHWFWVTLLCQQLSSAGGRALEELQLAAAPAPRLGRAMYFTKTPPPPPDNSTRPSPSPGAPEPRPNTTEPAAASAELTELTELQTEAPPTTLQQDGLTYTTEKPIPIEETTQNTKRKNLTKNPEVHDTDGGVAESRIVTEKPLSLETEFLQTRLPPSPEGPRRGAGDAGVLAAVCFAALAGSALVGSVAFVLYRRRFLNKPQTLNDKCSNPDSSGYLDDSTIRDNSEEMYSLDNDSFLNSLEAMTIQNYWTDTVKHTKL